MEQKLEDFVKKLEDRMADIEDKQDGDDENNKEKFSELEDKLEKLQVRMTEQQDSYEENIRELRHQLEVATIKQNEFRQKIDLLEETLEKSLQQQESFRAESSRQLHNDADVEVLIEKIHQQSGSFIFTMKPCFLIICFFLLHKMFTLTCRDFSGKFLYNSSSDDERLYGS